MLNLGKLVRLRARSGGERDNQKERGMFSAIEYLDVQVATFATFLPHQDSTFP